MTSTTEEVAPSPALRRVHARVEGTVQGVGFRPYVHRLVGELGLAGWVLNDARGVVLEVEGPGPAVTAFLDRLAAEAPPLARVERVAVEEAAVTGRRGFAIRPSPPSGEPQALVSPDTATCPQCLAELFDPADRRYRYPFLNCTNCGPRFTIITGVPYDRPNTTMAGFEMCARCRREYEDPADRRFHAQPVACPACGPALRLLDRGGRPLGGDPLARAVAALGAGAVVAVKGLGGYHLACVAEDEGAVARLRARKHREDKPFALMAPGLAAARELVELSADEEALLTGRERPIVLARRRPAARVAAAVAPVSPDLGVMLPYSPLHHLLAADTGATLVMTSGNVSDEPIAFHDEDALRRLAAIADLFLVHDRPIQTRTDDSVVRVAAGRPRALRRSRGYVPASLDLPFESPRPLLAVGAQLKNTFCVAKGSRAWVSHHVGDLENWATLSSFLKGIAHFERLFAVRPEIVAHDLHPEYLSTKHAAERGGMVPVGVQHHHAHLAACLAEHGLEGPAVGAIFDGTGLGTDGAIWGGELLAGGLASFERAGHLRPARLPGGEQAVREPWRMACAWLVEAGAAAAGPPGALAGQVDSAAWERVAQLARTGLASPQTTSVGRLFDAASALCGIRSRVNYEGQAAVELEAAAVRSGDRTAYPLPVVATPGGLVLDAGMTVLALVRDLEAGVPVPDVAARFHHALADAAAGACARLAEARGLDAVVLSGGAFQNVRLLERAAGRLERDGLRVLVPRRLPVNDGGISYGQAAVAAARLRAGAA